VPHGAGHPLRRLGDAVRLRRTRCPNSGIPCRGCYGPAPNVLDQGAKLLSAVSSIIDSKDPEEIDQILATLPDFASFANRYGVPASLLQRSHRQ
jgi:F420-non-reducing hydrogenase small subunit